VGKELFYGFLSGLEWGFLPPPGSVSLVFVLRLRPLRELVGTRTVALAVWLSPVGLMAR